VGHFGFHFIAIPHTRQLWSKRIRVSIYEFAELTNPSQNRALIHLCAVELSDVLSHLSQRSTFEVEIKRKGHDLGVKAALEKTLINDKSLATISALEPRLPALSCLAET
jgi:hypothetical protein